MAHKQNGWRDYKELSSVKKERLECLERLERLECLEHLERLVVDMT